MKTRKKKTVLVNALLTTAFVLPAIAPAESYHYDSAGRLINVAYDDGSGISYSYDNRGNIVLVEMREVASDLNGSGRVEMSDYARFQACFTAGAAVTPACQSADIDGDGAIDLEDFARLHAGITGP